MLAWQVVGTDGNTCDDTWGWGDPELYVVATVGSSTQQTSKPFSGSLTRSVDELLSFGCQSPSSYLTLRLVDDDGGSWVTGGGDDTCFTDQSDWT